MLTLPQTTHTVTDYVANLYVCTTLLTNRSAIAEERAFWQHYREAAVSGACFTARTSSSTSQDQQQQQQPQQQQQLAQQQLTAAPEPPLLVPAEPLAGTLSSSGTLIEKLLSAWEYIDMFRTELGCAPASFERVVQGTLLWGSDSGSYSTQGGPAEAILPRAEAVLFEEACMVLVKVLLLELQHLGGLSPTAGLILGKPLRDQLALKPLNLLTWPEHAAQCLASMAVHRCHSAVWHTDIARMINITPKVRVVLCIVCGVCSELLRYRFVVVMFATDSSDQLEGNA
jgi:hypothetical protein